MYKVMIVEDDRTIAALLCEEMQRWGLQALKLENFNDVKKAFLQAAPHLILMDISLPYYNGYYWCSEIRKVSKVPILFISSKTENMDIIMAMNMGGDDFITKPFSMEVLTAKVQAILRRTYSYQVDSDHLEHRGACLDTGQTVLYYQEEKIDLTKNEIKILEVLFKNKNKVVSRESIMQKLWDDESFIDDNTLTVNINRLRKKLEQYGLIDFIETKKGMGYLVRDESLYKR